MMTDKDTLNQVFAFTKRLNEALDDNNFPPKGEGRQTAAAARFGVSQKGARKWLEAEGMPRTSKINVIAKKLGVRAAWLQSGEGPKHAAPAFLREVPVPPDVRQKLDDLELAYLDQRLSDDQLRRALNRLICEVENP